jgi:hypothetical protein
MGGGGGGLESGGGSRGASLGGLGMRAMFSLILVCKSPLGRREEGQAMTEVQPRWILDGQGQQCQ